MSFPAFDPSHFTPEYLAQYNDDPVTAVAVLCIVLNTTFLAFRLLARYLQSASFGWDDGLVIMSWIVNLGFSATILLGVHYGNGHHIEWFIYHPELWPSRGLTVFIVEPILYAAAAAFPRLAILVLYLRIFTERYTRGASWLVIGICIIHAVINIFLIVYQCDPRSKVWYPFEPGHCHDVTAHWIWASFVNIITDLIMLLIPIRTIWRLQGPLAMKIGLWATFALGSIGMIFGVIRWATFYQNHQFITGDTAWYDNPLAIWAIVESTAYLLSACSLGYRGFWRNLMTTWPVSYISTALTRSRATFTSSGGQYRIGSLSQQDAPMVQRSTSVVSVATTAREHSDRATANNYGHTPLPFDAVYVRHEFNVHEESMV